MGETNKRHENENAGKMMKNHNQENNRQDTTGIWQNGKCKTLENASVEVA